MNLVFNLNVIVLHNRHKVPSSHHCLTLSLLPVDSDMCGNTISFRDP